MERSEVKNPDVRTVGFFAALRMTGLGCIFVFFVGDGFCISKFPRSQTLFGDVLTREFALFQQKYLACGRRP